MSIATAITNAQNKVAAAYTAVGNKGGTLPATQNLSNLPTAISSIPSGGGSGVGIPREVSANGVYQMPSSSFTFSLPSDVTDVGNYALQYAFDACTSLTSVDLSSLTTLTGSSAMDHAFYNCTSLTSADLSSLTTVTGTQPLQYAFSDCTSLTSVDLSSLTTLTGSSALYNAFTRCTSLTSVDLSSLTTLTGGLTLTGAFSGCISLTSVDLSSLTTVASAGALYQTFMTTRLANLSFPSLTSQSFGSYTNQFRSMLFGVTGCTVHFPSNLQSVIGSWSDVTAGFGGTDTTVLFDLPATT